MAKNIFEGFTIIDVGGTISAEGMTTKDQSDQLEFMEAMIAQQRDPKISEWMLAAVDERANANR